ALRSAAGEAGRALRLWRIGELHDLAVRHLPRSLGIRGLGGCRPQRQGRQVRRPRARPGLLWHSQAGEFQIAARALPAPGVRQCRSGHQGYGSSASL
ncbi:MAG: hypothetical protein AVDCRST_MAG91-736, partial [uncultured Sphingomonadaceae bacterium]